MTFDDLFETATGHKPFAFQRAFAEGQEIPQLVRAPTGLGKTAMAVLGWLWRRRFAPEEIRAKTPRRLIYCLPMRVLVEQTRTETQAWLEKLGLLADAAAVDDPATIAVHALLGGEQQTNWDLYPEQDSVLIGTQDMLLSRALNRGYAASRARWPLHFGQLHTDCLWLFDEIQLMGAGLTTTAQLEAFRRLLPAEDTPRARDGHGCRSVWMSATLDEDWLATVDYKQILQGLPADARLTFDFLRETTAPGVAEEARMILVNRWQARKPLSKAAAAIGDAKSLAAEVLQAHREACAKAGAGTRTIVVLNTVKRALELYQRLNRTLGKTADETQPSLVLLHSRFRPGDRAQQVDAALADPPAAGSIVVSTQVIEAGVNVSSATLFTELAPWASLVQRFGRCNRKGEVDHGANVHWIAPPVEAKEKAKYVAPYDQDDLDEAAGLLAKLADVGLAQLPEVQLRYSPEHVIRRADLIGLYDTTPDLAGNDIDIDRFVRDAGDSDVRVFWRNWDRKTDPQPSSDKPAVGRAELCTAPVHEFRSFLKKPSGDSLAWRWNFLSGRWEKAAQNRVVPGQVYMVHSDDGGYSPLRGWDPKSKDSVEPVTMPAKIQPPDDTGADRYAAGGTWQTIAEHTTEVCDMIDHLAALLSVTEDESTALHSSGRWHDRGKAHSISQGALPGDRPEGDSLWAKAPGQWKRYDRPHFRHELASALAVLLSPEGLVGPGGQRDLVAFLVAAHHGKVRLSIRSLPNERSPGASRFARGVGENDELPETPLGGGVTAPRVVLSLEPMELGISQEPPFVGQPSWTERMIRLRNQHGPFRLAYLEAILRAADIRVSKAAKDDVADATQSKQTAAEGSNG